MSKFNVGDEIYSFIFGMGVIEKIEPDFLTGTMRVYFSAGGLRTSTLTGFMGDNEKYPSLFTKHEWEAMSKALAEVRKLTPPIENK